MRYEEFPAPDRLGETVASFWRFALAGGEVREHTVVPDGTVSVVWARGMAILVGPRVTALRVPVVPGWTYWGIRFLPGVAGALLGVPVPAIREKAVPLAAVAPSLAGEFSAAMDSGSDPLDTLAAVTEGWVRRGSAPDPAVREMTRRIVASHGMAEIGELCQGIGLSYRQLLRRFHRDVGLTPKELARLRRIRWACLQAVISAESWAGISAEGGFSDQSHLRREFAGVFGWPPELVKEYLRRIEHRILF